MRRLATLQVLSILLLCGCGPFSTTARAAPAASTTDISDYIARMGGWLYKTDWRDDTTDQIHEAGVEYWRQVTYSIIPPSSASSNLTTIKMTEFLQQREDAKGVCSTEDVITDTVLIDMRELETGKITVTKSSAPVLSDLHDLENGKITVATGSIPIGSMPIWSVSLPMNGGQRLIRVVRTVTPPSILGFSAGTTTAGSGNATTCPAIRNGQQIEATTDQADVVTYPIQFAVEEEATYFKKLIRSAAANLNPPRIENGAP